MRFFLGSVPHENSKLIDANIASAKIMLIFSSLSEIINSL